MLLAQRLTSRTRRARIPPMEELTGARCSRCGGRVERRSTIEEFEREGVRVSISGIQALVCDSCGEVYLEPGWAQALVQAANGLFARARANRHHKAPLAGDVAR